MRTRARSIKEFDAAIAAEIRAEIGRQRSVQSVIALEAFGRPQQWLNRRLNGEVAFTAAEVLTIAEWLGVDAIDWIKTAKGTDPPRPTNPCLSRGDVIDMR